MRIYLVRFSFGKRFSMVSRFSKTVLDDGLFDVVLDHCDGSQENCRSRLVPDGYGSGGLDGISPRPCHSRLRSQKKALIFWGEQMIEAWRDAFRKVGDPECRQDPGKNVHGVVRAQDENGCDFENDEQDSGGGEPISAQAG